MIRKTLLLMAACAVLATACGPGSLVLRSAIDAERVNAGVQEALDSPYLDLEALLESVNACGRANGRSAPAPTFPGETYDDLNYVTRTSAIVDDDLAAQDIIDNLPGSVASVQVQANWDRQGIATYRCPDDGLLYATGVLSDMVSMPTSGRYVTGVFTDEDLIHHSEIRYGTAPLCKPNGGDLVLDIVEPSGDTLTERPLVVLVHGGGFTHGSRTDWLKQARQYARRGFVAATIDYRTCPGGFPEDELIQVVTNAIDDGMEAIRYLNANADTYGIDTSRIAVFGRSAGGAVALGTALIGDPTPGGPLAAHPFRPTAALSTGAHLTPGVDDPGFLADPRPVMMSHWELDGVSDVEWPYAYETCNEVHELGGVCDFIRFEGTGHVTGIGPTSEVYEQNYGPFIHHHLDLANAN